MNHPMGVSFVLLFLAALGRCVPTASSPAATIAQDITCSSAEPATVAFQHTTIGTGGLNVMGVEEAAMVRVTTLMVNSPARVLRIGWSLPMVPERLVSSSQKVFLNATGNAEPAHRVPKG